ncbi:restriction endonuclease subunit S [Chloroflexota bacterium]
MKPLTVQLSELALHRDLRCGLGIVQYRDVIGQFSQSKIPCARLANHFTLEYGKSLPEDHRSGKSYPVVGSNGIVGWHDYYLFNGPCIIIGRKGSAGSVNYIEQDCFPIDTTFYLKSISDSFRLKYIYYLLKVMRIDRLALFKAVPGLNRFDVYDIMIPKIPLDYQDILLSRIEPIESEINELKSRLVDPTKIIDDIFAEELHIDLDSFRKLAGTQILSKSMSDIGSNQLLRLSVHYQRYSGFNSYFNDIDNWHFLSDFYKISGGKRIPKGQDFSTEPTPYRYLRPNEVSFFGINQEELPYLTERTYQRLSHYSISSGNFAISIVGTIGKIALVDLDSLDIDEESLILSENFVKLSIKKDIANPPLNGFLFYFFHSFLFQLQLQKEYTIRTQMKLGLDKVRNLKFPSLLPIHESRIADDISTQLNRRNQLSEEIINKEAKLAEIVKNTVLLYAPN